MIDSYLTIANSPLLLVFLIMVAAAFGIMWLTSLEVEPKRYEAGWLRKNYIGFVIAVAALVAVSAIYFYLFGIGVSLSGLVGRLRLAAIDKDTNAEDIRHLGTTVALLMGVLAAAATIIFSIIRIWINERTATAAEEGLITDRISKAVEGLGAEKTVKDAGKETTKPNLEVRIGAIYALERIAQDSLRDHIQIMEILCAYIRENAPLRETPKNPFEIWEEKSEQEPEAEKSKMPSWTAMFPWKEKLPKPRTDIQVALEVIGRRKPRQIRIERDATVRGSKFGYRLDLCETCLQAADIRELEFSLARFECAQLQGADLAGAELCGADFTRAQLQGANLKMAELQRAKLWGAGLQGADLTHAQLRCAELSMAKMTGANLSNANLQSAELWKTQLQGANLMGARLQKAHLWNAMLQGADLSDALLLGTNLSETQLQGALLMRVQFDIFTSFRATSLRGAGLKEINFSNTQISYEQLYETFGDASVTPPREQGIEPNRRPKSWIESYVSQITYPRRWRAFQASIGQDPNNPT